MYIINNFIPFQVFLIFFPVRFKQFWEITNVCFFSEKWVTYSSIFCTAHSYNFLWGSLRWINLFNYLFFLDPRFSFKFEFIFKKIWKFLWSYSSPYNCCLIMVLQCALGRELLSLAVQRNKYSNNKEILKP